MKKTAIATALFAISGVAQAATVSSITITGGHFSMGQSYTAATCSSATSQDFGSCHELAVGTANTLTAGDTGSAKADTGSFSPDIAHFAYFGAAQVTSGLATSATAAQDANDWGSGFQGTTGVGTIDLNLGGYYANWNGTNFLQGTDTTGANGTSTSASGTTSGNTFDLEYSSYITGGSFDGQTGFWHLQGTFTEAAPEVPVPAAVWLFGSGLLGLVGVARRKKVA